MAKAIYYDANLNGKVFDVLKENKDGTVDIGTGDTVAVKSCVLVSDPKHGHAILCAAPVVTKPEEPKAEAVGTKPEDGKPKPEDRANRSE